MSPERAAATLELVAAAGINHIDTAASYGESELRLAPWLADHRDEVFLATKTGDRTGPEARASLERSLERLGVDRVDLIQLHNLVESDEWEQAHGPGGALEALAAARSEGLVDHIGVTGHGLRIAKMHVKSLEAFEYSSVLFPWNWALASIESYAADVAELLELCGERRVAAQTIKSIAKGRWGEAPAPRFSWYEPLTDPDAIGRAARWVLGDDQFFLNTSSDARLLSNIVSAAQGPLDRPADDVMAADAAQFGITALFDGAQLERI